MKNPYSILITGASSGLGAALSRHYAKPGVTLYLQGRHEQRLQDIAEICHTRGATVHTHVGDVTDIKAMEQWITKAYAQTPIDLVIANAGISAGTGIHGETGEQARHIFAVNMGGVINTIEPLIA